jgi:hypothetical protein
MVNGLTYSGISRFTGDCTHDLEAACAMPTLDHEEKSSYACDFLS